MLIKDLTKFANDLDAKGLYREAAVIDRVLTKLAAGPRPAGLDSQKAVMHGPKLGPSHGPDQAPGTYGPDTAVAQEEKKLAEYLIKNKYDERFARELAKLLARHPDKEGDEAWKKQQMAQVESKLGYGPYGPEEDEA